MDYNQIFIEFFKPIHEDLTRIVGITQRLTDLKLKAAQKLALRILDDFSNSPAKKLLSVPIFLDKQEAQQSKIKMLEQILFCAIQEKIEGKKRVHVILEVKKIYLNSIELQTDELIWAACEQIEQETKYFINCQLNGTSEDSFNCKFLCIVDFSIKVPTASANS